MSENYRHYVEYLNKNKDRINMCIKSKETEIKKKVEEEISFINEFFTLLFFFIVTGTNILSCNLLYGIIFLVAAVGIIIFLYYLIEKKRACLCEQLENKYIIELIDRIVMLDEKQAIDELLERAIKKDFNIAIRLVDFDRDTDELDTEFAEEHFFYNLTCKYCDIKSNHAYYADKLKKDYFIHRKIEGYIEE